MGVDDFVGWARKERQGLVQQGLWRGLHVQPRSPEWVNFSSNDYLGLSQNTTLLEALKESAARFPVGATSSRLLVGTTDAHAAAERALADFVGLSSSLLFASGYAANVGIIPAVATAGDGIFSDSLNHASLIDGCRLSRANTQIYRHREVDHLRSLLDRSRSSFRHCWIVTEAVFSMDGDEADLAAVAALANEYDAWLYVDEAHSLGVLGPSGSGLCSDAGVSPDLLIGTLGKAFGLAGAFVAGATPVIDLLVNRARSFVYSTGVLPALAGAIPTAVALVSDSEEARDRVRKHAQTIRSALPGAASGSRSAIVPVPLGDPDRAVSVSDRIRERGYLAQAIRPPTVPEGTSRLRCVPISSHKYEEVDIFVTTLLEELNA